MVVTLRDIDADTWLQMLKRFFATIFMPMMSIYRRRLPAPPACRRRCVTDKILRYFTLHGLRCFKMLRHIRSAR